MPPTSKFVALPDPGQASTLDEVADCLRRLKSWAGNPSYENIAVRVNAGRPVSAPVGKTTVVDCFRAGRRRLDAELVVAVVEALHPEVGYVTQWRQALRVIAGETRAAAQVRVQDELPADLPGFTGRDAELAAIRETVRPGESVVISALAGMAGVGKTRLAVHLGHRLHEEKEFDRILFVNLRGFHPDPAQPPADPAAVLDGFLRLLGVSGQNVPHRLDARTVMFRDRLAELRSLVVLDNAADEEQVRPLLPDVPGCVTLITSRRALSGLSETSRFDVDVFRPDEALRYLASAAPGVETGDDPDAAARIAARSGYLPLALALIAGQMRAKPGWTLTDHADRLDERHADRRLDSGVELALDVSYRNLPDEERRLLRLVSLHPGQDFDAYAAAALSGAEVEATAVRLGKLTDDHLLQVAGPNRYTLHDLVRAYGAARATDEDRRSDRQAAMTRLFDWYLAAAVAAMNRLDPADAVRRPAVEEPPTPLPDLTDPTAWLDAERPNLVAAAEAGPSHTVRLSATLFRYLLGGHHHDALNVHGLAATTAERAGDPAGQAGALTFVATSEILLGRHTDAADHLRQAQEIFERAGDELGRARALNNLSIAETRLGRYRDAVAHASEALRLYQAHDAATWASRAQVNLGNLKSRMGREAEAIEHFEQARAHYRTAGDLVGEAVVLSNMGGVEARLGRFDDAEEHLDRTLELVRQQRNQASEASAIDFLGTLWIRRGDPARGAAFHREAMEIFVRMGDRHGQSCAHNGLGEAALASGSAGEAIAEHTAAYDIAAEEAIADVDQQARAQQGLAEAHRFRGSAPAAAEHYRRARDLWCTLMNDAAVARVDEALLRLAGER